MLFAAFDVRAVPFKSVGRSNGSFLRGGGGGVEGPNSELFYPIRLHMNTGRRGGGGGVEFLIIFRSSPLHTS